MSPLINVTNLDTSSRPTTIHLNHKTSRGKVSYIPTTPSGSGSISRVLGSAGENGGQFNYELNSPVRTWPTLKEDIFIMMIIIKFRETLGSRKVFRNAII